MKKLILSIIPILIVGPLVFGVPYLLKQNFEIRKPAVAGSFYPSNPDQLKKMIDSYLAGQKTEKIKGSVSALICPHAGYVYSGKVAAASYNQIINNDYETVVIIAPSHIEYFRGCSVYEGNAYETPLGKVYIDKEYTDKLVNQTDVIEYSEKGHKVSKYSQSEHSVEVQLPFLQIVLGKFKLVPIVMGEQNLKTASLLGNAIAEVFKNRKVLIVASTDLSHFHSYEEAKLVDERIINAVSEYDYQEISEGLKEKRMEACGGYPVVATMIAAEKLGAKEVKVLDYATSADTEYGQKSRVVGYMSAVFYKDKDNKEKKKDDSQNSLSEKEKELLLKIAKNSIESAIKGKKPKNFNINSEVLRQKRGAFVTIEKHGELRGCIGFIYGIQPLYETVREAAKYAALKDRRFEPVTADELGDLKLEISVLTPLKKIENPNKVEVGKHGLYIRKGRQSGLLLPQVPVEQKWDRLTFLRHTCLKAGLSPDAWKEEDTDLFIFTAEIFSEE